MEFLCVVSLVDIAPSSPQTPGQRFRCVREAGDRDVTPQDFPFKIVHSCKSIFITAREAKREKDFEMKHFFTRSLWRRQEILQSADFKCGIRKNAFFYISYPKGFFSFSLRFASNWTDARDFLAKAMYPWIFQIKNILNDVSRSGGRRRREDWAKNDFRDCYRIDFPPPWAVLKVIHSLLQ